ncbi:MAG: DUF2325 domain-containing protein [Thermincolia bacterium]
MTLALVGGMDRLEKEYRRIAEEHKCQLKVIPKVCPKYIAKIQGVDCIIMCTNMVSHKIAKSIVKEAKGAAIPLVRNHSSGLSTFTKTVRSLCDQG